ncbi:MAG: MOSC domain-containing protein [Candidatus Sungbacteria bacterium]|nr:MOSC domain-containing protein [Candidatus Sungbacteria bacterium]
MEKIGTVAGLRRYPVKSMRGEDLTEVFVSYAGVAGDRVYAFVDDEKAARGDNFPWVSGRMMPELLLYAPRFYEAIGPGHPYPDAAQFRVEVATPDGERFDITDPRLISELAKKLGRKISLRFSERGMQDSRPFSLVGTSTIRALEQELGMPVAEERFRMNCSVAWDNDEPFFEDTLVGRTIRIGEKLELVISKKDTRCSIITVDPKSGGKTPEILAHVARHHGNCVGVYAVVLREGTARNGDPIYLL